MKSRSRKKKYIIQVGVRTQFVGYANSLTQAKYQIWNTIKDGYTYGFRNRAEFMKGTKEVK